MTLLWTSPDPTCPAIIEASGLRATVPYLMPIGVTLALCAAAVLSVSAIMSWRRPSGPAKIEVAFRSASARAEEIFRQHRRLIIHSLLANLTTRFSLGEVGNGSFQIVGPDLWFIKTRNTSTCRVEVHSVTAASGYNSGTSSPTRFSLGEVDNGSFQIVGTDLWFIKTRNTSTRTVEVHSVTAASGYNSGTDGTIPK